MTTTPSGDISGTLTCSSDPATTLPPIALAPSAVTVLPALSLCAPSATSVLPARSRRADGCGSVWPAGDGFAEARMRSAISLALFSCDDCPGASPPVCTVGACAEMDAGCACPGRPQPACFT
eukprot:3156313-Rhodomonas_salina.2